MITVTVAQLGIVTITVTVKMHGKTTISGNLTTTVLQRESNALVTKTKELLYIFDRLRHFTG